MLLTAARTHATPVPNALARREPGHLVRQPPFAAASTTVANANVSCSPELGQCDAELGDGDAELAQRRDLPPNLRDRRWHPDPPPGCVRDGPISRVSLRVSDMSA